MKFQKFLYKDDMVKYYFSDFEESEDFFKISKKIKKLKNAKVKIIEKVNGFSFLMHRYSVFGGEVYLYNEHMTGNFLTIVNEKDGPALEKLVNELILIE